jgi:hypothetical protein
MPDETPVYQLFKDLIPGKWKKPKSAFLTDKVYWRCHMEISQRYRGCLLGLAVGDAVGTHLEFKRPGNFKPITDMIDSSDLATSNPLQT